MKRVFEQNFHQYFEHSGIPLHFLLGLCDSVLQSRSRSSLNGVEMKEHKPSSLTEISVAQLKWSEPVSCFILRHRNSA